LVNRIGLPARDLVSVVPMKGTLDHIFKIDQTRLDLAAVFRLDRDQLEHPAMRAVAIIGAPRQEREDRASQPHITRVLIAGVDREVVRLMALGHWLAPFLMFVMYRTSSRSSSNELLQVGFTIHFHLLDFADHGSDLAGFLPVALGDGAFKAGAKRGEGAF